MEYFILFKVAVVVGCGLSACLPRRCSKGRALETWRVLLSDSVEKHVRLLLAFLFAERKPRRL